MTTFLRCLISTLLTVGLLVTGVHGPAAAAKNTPEKKTTTYLVSLQLEGRTVAGPFSSTESVTAEFVARPTTTGSDPTQWSGEGTVNFGPIVNSGLPAGCTLTNTPPTGTMRVAITKSGSTVTVDWSPNITIVGPGVGVCMGQPFPFVGAPAAEPFAFLEPRQFTLPTAGGSQQLLGKLDTGDGMMENIGTLTITERTECGQKVKEVNTYPPGQQTSASSMVGKGFAVGEKVTADTNVEFVFEDGSVARLAKGTSIKQDAKCESFTDKSRSFKGTLLLGKIWFHVSKVFGAEEKVWVMEPCVPPDPHACVAGVRGTTFWILPGKKRTTLSVSEGSVWLSRAKGDKLTGKKVIVKKGHTAVATKKKITVRKLLKKDAFPFG